MTTDHEEPCGPSHRSFCLNGGLCYVIPTIPSPFCRIDWCELLAVQRTLKSLLQHSSKTYEAWKCIPLWSTEPDSQGASPGERAPRDYRFWQDLGTSPGNGTLVCHLCQVVFLKLKIYST
ncbi:pro-neuregulin-4, membrane-bound isoform isoform X3 [Odocoileus virginianus]|uniref:Pro-neuregulin-4, membrane-bound isoform isoform X3 n=1 Tax=Odocoileus virginianus TaxID=9874 RepID=A0ABM4J0Y9_ODOVR